MNLFLNRLLELLSGLFGPTIEPAERVPPQASPADAWDYETEREIPHECGHALVAWLSPAVMTVDRIVFHPGGGATTFAKLLQGRYDSKLEELVFMLGGLAGEIIVWRRTRGQGLGGVTHADLPSALRLAREISAQMRLRAIEKTWGARLAPASLDLGSMFVQRPPPEIAAVMNLCYRRAKFLLTENKAGFLRLCALARGRRDLSHEDIQAQFGPRPWSPVGR